MDMKDWARQEILLAKNRISDAEEKAYMEMCYDSALKAYNCLMKDNHSGMSFGITRNILEKLLYEIPLSPIEDTPEMWNGPMSVGNEEIYQHKRLPSLCKAVNKRTGRVRVSDHNRVVCRNLPDRGGEFYNGFITEVIDGLYPIAFPYQPTRKKYIAYVNDFLMDPANGDFDTMHLVSVRTPDGELRPLNFYYKEVDGHWCMITLDEWAGRKKKAFEMNKEVNNGSK